MLTIKKRHLLHVFSFYAHSGMLIVLYFMFIQFQNNNNLMGEKYIKYHRPKHIHILFAVKTQMHILINKSNKTISAKKVQAKKFSS